MIAAAAAAAAAPGPKPCPPRTWSRPSPTSSSRPRPGNRSRWAGSRSWTRSSKTPSTPWPRTATRKASRRAEASSWSTSACRASSSSPQVREAAFDRAVSLMEAIATKTISEGEQRKKEIINKTEAEVQKIEGEGKQEANILKGKADAEIIDSYAKAIRETGEFYNFIRTLEVYKEAFKGETRLILTTDSALLKLIKNLEPLKLEIQAQPGGLLPCPGISPAATTTAASSSRVVQ